MAGWRPRMLRSPTFGWLCVGALTLALSGCGGGDDDDAAQCTPLDISGEPLVTSGMGQGKAHGSAQLPSSVKDGMELELLVLNDAGGSSVFPDNLVASTCGPSFTFHIRGLD